MTQPAGHAVPDDDVSVARRLYDALTARDAQALLAAITPGFRGTLAEGMPAGLSGTYDGAETMFRQCWVRVFELADVRPVPAEYLPVGAGRVVVLGRYHGTARSTGREFSAAFAHLLRITNSQVSELVQITDTARWHEALAP